MSYFILFELHFRIFSVWICERTFSRFRRVLQKFCSLVNNRNIFRFIYFVLFIIYICCLALLELYNEKFLLTDFCEKVICFKRSWQWWMIDTWTYRHFRRNVQESISLRIRNYNLLAGSTEKMKNFSYREVLENILQCWTCLIPEEPYKILEESPAKRRNNKGESQYQFDFSYSWHTINILATGFASSEIRSNCTTPL